MQILFLLLPLWCTYDKSHASLLSQFIDLCVLVDRRSGFVSVSKGFNSLILDK